MKQSYHLQVRKLPITLQALVEKIVKQRNVEYALIDTEV